MTGSGVLKKSIVLTEGTITIPSDPESYSNLVPTFFNQVYVCMYVPMYVLQLWTIHKSRGDYSQESGPGKNRQSATGNCHDTHN